MTSLTKFTQFFFIRFIFWDGQACDFNQSNSPLQQNWVLLTVFKVIY
jgi:hypothetical protein